MGEASPKEGPALYVRKSSGLLRAISAREALIANLVGMGIIVNIFWVVFASAGYPNADLPATVFIGLGLSLLIAFVYWMLSSAMPRTGGDYVYVSRIFHPGLGFIVNAMFVGIMVSWAGLFPYFTAAYAFPILFQNMGMSLHSAYFTGLAGTLASSSGVDFEIGAIIVTFVIASMLLPVRWVFRILVAMFVIQAIVYAWFIGALAVTSHQTFVSGVNANFGNGVTYSAITSAAVSKYSASFGITFAATLVGVVYTMLSYIGYANSAYFAGELRGDPRKSQGLAIFVAPIIFSVLIYLLYYEVERVFGHDFLVAASTLAVNGDPLWSVSVVPSPAYLISFISSNPYFTAAVPLALILTFIGFAMVYFLIPVRNIFAWSFDRIIPMKFADVSSRGVPWVAVLFYGAIAYISLYASIYTKFLSYLTYANLGWWIAVAVVMFAAAALPFRKRDIYSSAPSIVRKSIGPLPVLTLVGVIGGLLSLFVSYTTILPSYNSGLEITTSYVGTIVAIFVIALVIFVISYAYNRSKGVPLELLTKELPPE
ncbi:MAG: APC family permease [Nitrososphaerota archaeon]|nr:APC family permease [Nitrososphaerota archaeon]